VTVWTPARSPIAIDATFKLLGSSEYPAAASALQRPALTPLVVPHRNASHSFTPDW